MFKPKPLKPVVLAYAFKLFVSFVRWACSVFKQILRLQDPAKFTFNHFLALTGSFRDTLMQNRRLRGVAVVTSHTVGRLKAIAVIVLISLGFSIIYAVNFHAPTVSATPNNTLNFQARLETASGAIAPDGDYNVSFHLFDTLTSSGSTDTSCNTDTDCLWTEQYTYNSGPSSSDVRIHVANGYLTVDLGSITAFPGTINWDQNLYLTMDIGGTSGSSTTWDGQMSPRLHLTAVPYALQAKSSEQLQQLQGTYTDTLQFATDTLQGNTITLPDLGTSFGLLALQSSSPGTQQTGNFNITGTGLLSTLDATGSGTANTLTIGGANASTTGGGISLGSSVTSGFITLGGTATTGDITIGQYNGASTSTINIGANAGASSTQTVHIADSSSGINNVTVGSLNSSSATMIQGGTGNVAINTGTGASTTGSISIATGNSSGGNSGNISIDTGTNVPSGTVINTNTFESGTENYTNLSNLSSIATTLSFAHGGTQSLALTQTIAGGWATQQTGGSGPNVTPGHIYYFTGWMRGDTSAQTTTMAVNFWNSIDGNNGVDLDTETDNTSGWTEFSGTAIAPAYASGHVTEQADMVFDSAGGGAGEVQYLDDVQITDLSSVLVPKVEIGAANAQAITVGNRDQAGVTTVQGGAAGLNLQVASNGTINIGSVGVSSDITNVHIADSTNSGLEAVSIGSSSAAENTVTLTAGATTESLADSGDTIKTNTNSVNAFQVQDAASNNLFNVDTSGYTISLGAAATNNGYTSIGATDNSGAKDGIQFTKLTTATGGAMSSISTYFSVVDTAPNNKYQVALYDATGGSSCGFASECPGARIAFSGDNTATAGAWNTVPLSATLLPNTSYWLAVNVNSNTTAVKNDTSTGSYIFQSGITYNTWPNPYSPSSPFTASHRDSIYATISTNTTTTANGTLKVMPTTGNDSTTAFQVQDAAGTSNLVVADTANNMLGIGMAPSTGTTSDKLQVGGNAEVVGNELRVGPTSYGIGAQLALGGANSGYVVIDKANTTSDASLIFRDQGNTRAEIGLATDNDIHFKYVTGSDGTDGSGLTFTDAMRIFTSNANGTQGDVEVQSALGIGTSTPGNLLHIANNSAGGRPGIKLENTDVTGGSSGSTSVEFKGQNNDFVLGNDSGLNGNDNFFLQDATNSGFLPLFINGGAGGHDYVGIGNNTNPQYPLDVTGDINTSTQYRIGGNVTLTSSALTFNAASTATVQAATSQALNITSHGTSTWSTDSGDLTVQSAGALNLTGAANSTWTVGSGNTLGITSSNFNVSTTGAETLGTASSAGSLVLQDGSGHTVTFQSGGAQANSPVLSLPSSVAATDTICLQTKANCSSGASSKSVTEIVAMSSTSTCSTPNSVASSDTAGADYVATGCAADTAIQTAINDVSTNYGGGVVYLEEGTYIITTQIDLKSNVTLEGAGANTILKFKNATNAFTDMLSASTGSPTRVVVKDLRLDGNLANQSSGGMTGLYISTSSPAATVDHVSADNFYGGYGFQTSGSGTVSISNSEASGNGSYGFYINSANASVANSVATSNGNHGFVASNSSINLTNDQAKSNTGYGFDATGSNVTMSGDIADSNSSIGFGLGGGNDAVSGSTAVNNTGDGFNITGGSYNTITGNTSTSNHGQGIYIGWTYNVVTGNTIYKYNSGNDGIWASNGDNTITGNIIIGNGGSGYAIDISAGTASYLADNQYSGTGATTIHDAGTGTIYGAQTTDTSGDLLQQATGITQTVGTGNYVLNGAVGSTYAIGAATVGGSITLGGASQTGVITLGKSTVSSEIDLGNAAVAGGSTQTIKIGSGATSGNGNDVLTIGDLFNSSTTTIQGGTGVGAIALTTGNGGSIALNSSAGTGAISLTTGVANINLTSNGSTNGTVVKSSTNSTSAFQVQNSDSTPVISVDDTANALNLISNPSFEANATGWTAKGAAGAPARVTSPVLYGVGAGSETTTAAANDGIKYAVSLSSSTR